MQSAPERCRCWGANLSVVICAIILLCWPTDVAAQRSRICSFGGGYQAGILNEPGGTIEEMYQSLGNRVFLVGRQLPILRAGPADTAIAYRDETTGQRMIVYSPDYLERVGRDHGRYLQLFILAHELGHHFMDHSHVEDVSPEQALAQEREADGFAAELLASIGARPADLSRLARILTADSTHPPPPDRQAAVTRAIADRVAADAARTEREQQLRLAEARQVCEAHAGQVWRDGVCARRCEAGQRWNGTACESLCDPHEEFRDGVCQSRCTDSQRWSGTACVDRCRGWEAWDGSRCVAVCLEWEQWDGERCLSRCPDGERLENGICMPRCDDDERWDGRRCRERCTEADRWDGLECVSRCRAGERWNGAACVDNCPAGSMFSGGRCRPRTAPPGTQLGPCGCWGFTQLGPRPDPRCSSGMSQPTSCMSPCPIGVAWTVVCL